MDLSFGDPQFHVHPVIISPPNQLLCDFPQLLHGNLVLLHEHGDGCEPNNVLEEMHPAVRRKHIFTGVARLKEASTVLRAQLPVRKAS